MKNKLKFYSFLFILFSVLVCSACGDKNDDTEEPEIPTPSASDKKITSFVFEAGTNGLSENLTGVFDATNTQIIVTTQKLIKNIDKLIPKFSAVGTVKVENDVQVSGETANDFRQSVVYSVVAADNSVRKYVVVFRSPQASGLPVIIINTDGGRDITSKENYITADIKVSDANKESNSFETRTEIRGRGNSTWGYAKKPYRLKFLEKTSLFGYPAEKSWVLLANWLDPTLIMNTVAFKLGNNFGLPYTNHYTHVEIFLNGNYKGSYMLTEQVQVKKTRVNVDEKKGFLVELDSYWDEDPKFKTDILKLPVMIKSPEELSDPAGYDFVREALNELEAALYSPTFPNNNYQDLIDVNTFIDFMLVNELVRNIEVKHPKSIYMYKKDQSEDSKICMGPLWDFDWAFGYREDGQHGNYFMNSKMKDMLIRPDNQDSGEIGNRFFGRFLDDPDFRTKYKARWNEHYTTGRMDMIPFIDDMAASLELSQQENYKLWPNGLSYKDQISKMKSWWSDRLEYLNNEINKY